MASRIHGDVYVRFRGRYAETCRRKAVRRCIPSLQTNLQEARPELWKKLEAENSRPKIGNGEHFSFAPVDTMIRDNLWICPIKPLYQNDAYYSISKNVIVVPEKGQFKSGESFYGTLFHEMIHSTGTEGVLDRFKPASFGSSEYIREELVAELGSEKIDIIKYSDDPAEYIAAALAPADVVDVRLAEEGKACRVIVPDDQLSLAIGKEGQNARLAARLVGYKIDIKPESYREEE